MRLRGLDQHHDRSHDRVERHTGWPGSPGEPVSLDQPNFRPNLIGARQQHHTPLLGEVAVDGPDAAAKDAVDRHAEGCCFAVHRAAATDDEVGVPHEVEAVDRRGRNDHLAAGKQGRPPRRHDGTLLGIAGQHHDLHVLGTREHCHHRIEQQFGFGVVVVRFRGGWAHGHHDVIGAEAELAGQRRLRGEGRRVDILLDPRVLEHTIGKLARNRDRDDVGHDHATGAVDVFHMLVVSDHHRRDAEQFGHHRLRTRAVRDREVRHPAPHQRQQLRRPHQKAEAFHQFVLAEMAADRDAWHLVQAGQIGDLESISCGQDDPVAPGAQFVDDRMKEGHVRRVVEVDPDRLRRRVDASFAAQPPKRARQIFGRHQHEQHAQRVRGTRDRRHASQRGGPDERQRFERAEHHPNRAHEKHPGFEVR